ncbi:MAG: magnesium transporter [Ruminococcaceae bacterium]|nr:magnesium transporter [Oscillospiraceae bacterium]
MNERILELLETRSYAKLKEELIEMNPYDIACVLAEIPKEMLALLFRILPKEIAAETFVEMDADMQQHLIDSFNDNELKAVLSELYVDDAVDIIEEMPANVVKRILKHTDIKTRAMINEILNYPKDSAGSIMTTEYVDLKKNMTVADAFARIRKTGTDKETIYTCYVINSDRKLIGLISAKELMLAEQSAVIEDIMETNIIFVNTYEDKEEVAQLFDKYDFLAIPVVDKEERLVGIVTIDDAIDVIQEEVTEDFAKMAAITSTDATYFKTPVWKHAKSRIFWLLFLMFSAIITGTIISKYEKAFEAVPLLVSFIPMLMGTGGNCGSQASTMIIRGMALDEINVGDFFKAVLKESAIALLVGFVLALVNSIRIIIMYNNEPGINAYMLAFVLAITLMCIILLSKILGCALPMIAKKLKLDPAIMAAPVISTILDTCSVLIFFNFAVRFMQYIIK